jgi:hypothetical protein
VHSVVCTPISSLRKAKSCFAPRPGALGDSGRSSAIPASGQTFGRSAPGPGHRAFSFATRIEEAQKRPLPASGAGTGAAPPPPHPPTPNHRPGQLVAHIALHITWGGLVGGRGHRKGQLRVLGSPSTLHTKQGTQPGHPGGAPGGRGVRGPDCFGESPLIHT